jgi:ubiquinol-cytochrome c reductase subunit 6
MSSIIASFFSSFVSTVHADAPSDEEKPAEEVAVVEEAAAEEEPEPEDVRVFPTRSTLF